MRTSWRIPLILIGVVAVVAYSVWMSKKSSNEIVIGITQIIQHPALDDEREGLLATLSEAGYTDGKNIKIVYQNAQGSPTLAAQIASKLVSLNPKVVVGLSTPSAQALMSAIGTKKIPLVFAAITDPVAAKLVAPDGKSTEWVTGASDALAPGPQLDLLLRFVPKLQTIGIIYNSGEANSVAMVEGLKKVAKEKNLTVRVATAGSTNDVPQATQTLVEQVQAIYVPLDNTAVAALEGILHVAAQKKIPVFAADTSSVDRGAVAAAGYNYKIMGRRTGELVVKILKGESPKNIPVLYDHPTVMTVNREAAKTGGVVIPADLPADTVYVDGKAK